MRVFRYLLGSLSVLMVVVTGGCAGSDGPRSRPMVGAVRIESAGLAAEWAPGIDRCVYFGPSGGPNMLLTRSLDRLPASDGAYTFFGGCYIWVAPQKGPLGWKSSEDAELSWPPAPAMDIGPTRISGRSHNSITTVGPRQRTGLVENTTLTLRDGLVAELRSGLRNESGEARVAGVWVTTAVGEGDVIALRIPAGTNLRGWDEASVSRLKAVMGPPSASGWVTVDLKKVEWEGEIKVYIEAPTSGGEPSRIAVWRCGYWFVRTGSVMDESIVARLREVGEGPVAVYIEPGRKGDAEGGGIVEAEMYGPIEVISPGGKAVVSEEWRLIPAALRGDVSALPE